MNRRQIGLLLTAALSGGCVAVYQPLSGLQAPVVVDPDLANFQDLRLLVHCVPKDLLEDDAGLLCQQVQLLFENQGARVQTVTTMSRVTDPEEGSEENAGEVEDAAPSSFDMSVELRARALHEDVDWLLWTLSILTVTLAPGISENSFVQEVVIRDARGELLVTGELKGRIVRYFGLGSWASNRLLDLTVRDDDEELNDERLSEMLSADLYGQLSQMVFNANMRRRVLGASGTPDEGGS